MAWINSDYITTTTATEKLAKLRLHVREVADALANPKAHNIDGMGFTMPELQVYLSSLKTELNELEQRLGVGINKPMSFAIGQIV